MTVLITGGAGFIGSRLALALRQQGERLVLVDNFDPYYDPALKHANVALFAGDPAVHFIEADIRDGAQMEQIVRAYGVERIAHLAALAGVRYSVEEGPRYVEVNVNGSVNLLEAARKNRVQVFVQASTSSVYGQTQRLPFVEDDPADHPLAPYPATKRAAEIMGHSYHHLFGLHVTCLRFFNVYGPNGRPDMMPLKVMRSVMADTPIEVFAGGKLQRDWTYIDDIVAGIIAALYRPLGYRVINLGRGAPIPLNDFIEIIEALSGKAARRIEKPAPATEPTITFCDNTLARTLLGFNPQTSIRDGLAQTWAWLQSIQPTRG